MKSLMVVVREPSDEVNFDVGSPEDLGPKQVNLGRSPLTASRLEILIMFEQVTMKTEL